MRKYKLIAAGVPGVVVVIAGNLIAATLTTIRPGHVGVSVKKCGGGGVSSDPQQDRRRVDHRGVRAVQGAREVERRASSDDGYRGRAVHQCERRQAAEMTALCGGPAWLLTRS